MDLNKHDLRLVLRLGLGLQLGLGLRLGLRITPGLGPTLAIFTRVDINPDFSQGCEGQP